MYNKMGDKRSSLEYESFKERRATTSATCPSMHVHDLTIDVDLEMLRGAVAAWREAGRQPSRSFRPGARGSGAPGAAGPGGSAYLYDHGTGEVKSRSRFKLHHGSGRAGW